MAFSTTWSVVDLDNKKHGELTNIVAIGVKCTVTEGSYKGEWSSRFKIGSADTTSPGYIGFSSITEAQALQWVKEQMGSAAIDEAEMYGRMVINTQKSPAAGTSDNSLPW
mgnify:FL=1|tara:strand:+ start:1758 stop:2087 length:330 start_codon:yes stop_codon:yes gene_type:complete